MPKKEIVGPMLGTVFPRFRLGVSDLQFNLQFKYSAVSVV